MTRALKIARNLLGAAILIPAALLATAIAAPGEFKEMWWTIRHMSRQELWQWFSQTHPRKKAS